ncbi:MAG: hypothetical protein R2731_18865 [Nocardioides sp.]
MTQPTAARLARAATLLDLRRHAEAEALLRGALAEDPESAEGLRLLARSLLGQRRAQEALSAARAAVALAPDELSGQAHLAHAAEDAGEHAEARDGGERGCAGLPAQLGSPLHAGAHAAAGRRAPVSTALSHARHATTLALSSSPATSCGHLPER